LSAGAAGPSRYASSQSVTCKAPTSASEYTATVRTPIRRAVRATRQAISPRLAIRILSNIAGMLRSARRRVRVTEPALDPRGRRPDEAPELGQQPGGRGQQQREHDEE